MINTIQGVYEAIKNESPKRVVLAQAVDSHALPALIEASREGYAIPILVGSPSQIRNLAENMDLDLSGAEIVEAREGEEAVKAVELIKEGRADVIMKGLMESAPFLKAVLKGIKKEGSVVSAIALVELKKIHRFCFITDLAINPRPSLETKESILVNTADIVRKFGYERPKIAVLSAAETLNPKMRSSRDAAELAKNAAEGKYGNCVVAGPISLDIALSDEAARQKNYSNEVAGNADVLLVPDIETGNSFYKGLMLFADIETGGIIAGTTAPVVFCSRADSAETKKNTLALAIYLASVKEA